MQKPTHPSIAAILLVMGGTAFASELTAYAGTCLTGATINDTPLHKIGPCPSISRISPSLTPNEEVRSESTGRYVQLASPADPTSANIALSALSKARADYGSLGVYSTVGSFGHATNGQAWASAAAGSGFTDTLVIGSASLPNGSPVTLHYDDVLTRSIYTFDPDGPLQSGYTAVRLLAQLQLSFSAHSVDPVELDWCAGGCDPKRYVVISPNGSDTFSGSVPLHVGDTIFVTAFLPAMTDGAVLGGPYGIEVFGTGNAEVDAYHSAHPYFRIDGADAFLLANSGHDYTMKAFDVAEPTPWQAILLGLVGVLVSFRRSSVTGKWALDKI